MAQESRTSKSLKNAQVALIYYFLQLILGFFSRKAFLDYLGSEILGLNTTATNLLGFLNLAELGVSSAVSYFLYLPLYDKDYTKLNKLISLQGWIYRNVAFFIIIASVILMCFFPLIFKKSPLPIWYAYLTFGILLFSSILGYFYNYRQIIFNADQKGYKIQEYVQGCTIIKTILQILAITLLPYPFFSWLTLEFIGTLSTTIILNHIIKKNYPWLKTKVSEGKKYLKEYPEILKKTGQAFFHRIGGVILGQSSPLIIYAFTNLTTVALYGNYILIIGKAGNLLASIFNSTGAAIGNLVASNDRSRIIKVFWELYDSRMCMSVIILLCLYHLTNPFITIWVGEKYCLSNTFLALYIILSSIGMIRITIDHYLYAYGLFKDIWAPLTEAGLNIGCSILLGYFWGLNGIIIGIFISQFIIISLWKPYFLFKEGLQINPISFFLPACYRVGITIILFLLSFYAFKPLHLEQINTIKDFMIKTLIVGFSCFIIGSITFYILFPGTKDFVARINNIVTNKFSKK